MNFEHCHSCKPPTRHVGCHGDCPYYQADISARSAAKEEKRRLTDAKCDWLCARQFKTRRYQRLKGQPGRNGATRSMKNILVGECEGRR